MDYKYKNFGELIKWPQCVIVGEKVELDQAREILRRCDLFFTGSGSNHREYDEYIWKAIKRPEWDYDNENYIDYAKRLNEWDKKYGILQLEYLYTNNISSCFIGGVHGWCHPNGEIFFNENVGKWPSWEELHSDCKTIAKAFPFLDMKVYLFNQEAFCEDLAYDGKPFYNYEKKCVGGFKIKNGRVYLMKPSEFLSKDSEYCQERFKDSKEHLNYLIEQKKEIFGDDADIEMLEKDVNGFLHNEIFFSIPEFIAYFDKIEFEINEDNDEN